MTLRRSQKKKAVKKRLRGKSNNREAEVIDVLTNRLVTSDSVRWPAGKEQLEGYTQKE